MPGTDDPKAAELVGAYVDGVAELDPEERARVERLLRDEPAIRADADAARELLGSLRELSRDDGEPDWGKLEQQIRTAVGPTVPRSWWQRWRWIVPLGTLATAAAVALLWLHHPPSEPVAARFVATTTEPASPPTETAPPPTTMWLDGEAVDVGDVDPSAIFGEIDQEAPVAGADSDTAILPPTDLGWIDNLDDSAIDRAETWLASHHGRGHGHGKKG